MGGAIKFDPIKDIMNIGEQIGKFDPIGDIKGIATSLSPKGAAEKLEGGDVIKAAGGALGGVGGATAPEDAEASKRRGVSKKKAGTGGTQVPLQATQSAPTTGIQI